MSQHHDSLPKRCPNCSFPATHNYCAQCGQETHLHRDTFFGLIWHFAGHYFHYDSKFWKTLKALWFAPGKLTKEYFEGKRARSIPPISLYIFISAVYFIIASFSIGESGESRLTRPEISVTQPLSDSARNATSTRAGHSSIRIATNSVRQAADSIDDGTGSHLVEKMLQKIPKLFFFMIPVLAMMLRLLMIRRKTALFSHHAVFSLHIHSFFFSAFLINALNPFGSTKDTLTFLLLAVGFIYGIAALRKVYGLTRIRAFSYAVIISLAYALFFALAMLVLILTIAGSAPEAGAH